MYYICANLRGVGRTANPIVAYPLRTELTRKPYSSSILLLCSLFLQFCLSFPLSSQPKIFENGRPSVAGEDVGVEVDSPTRKKIDLAGTWTYSLDRETWTEVKVPSSFDFEGKIVFRKKFTLDEPLLRSSVFKFISLGINHECEVYVNDIFIGKHVGGFTTVEFDIPDEALQLGPENTIQITVSNVLNSRSTIPLRKQVWEWRSYGGLVRDVYLLATPRVWISSVSVRPTVDDEMKHGNVLVSATLSDRAPVDTAVGKQKPPAYALALELYDKLSRTLVAQSAAIPVTVELNKERVAELAVQVNSPKLWSPEVPELYLVRATLTRVDGKQKTMIDQCSRVVGFIKRATEKGSIIVNGAPVVLKGVVWHEDHPRDGASLTYEQMEKDLVLIKSLGANAVRFAFHPPHPYVVGLCARYGLFALEELPLCHAPVDILSDETYQNELEAYAHDMIARDADNPAVLAWGLGDGFDSASWRSIAFVKRLAAAMRAVDSRPIYYGSRMIENDVAATSVDFAAVDISSVDLKSFRRLLLGWKKNHEAQPVILLSYGKEVDHMNRNGRSDPMSQESQAYFFFQQFAVVRELGIAGSFISSFADWRGDRPVMSVNVADHYLHPVGLMNYDREKRLSYDMVRTLYNDEKISAIPVGNYRATFPAAHVLSGLFVIMLVGYQYTYNRRFGEAVKRAFLRSYNFFADLRDLHAVSVFQTLLLAFAISVTLAVIVSSFLYHFRADRFADYVLTYIVVSDYGKEQLINAAWHSLAGIAMFTGLWFISFAAVTLLILICAVVFRKKISWFHAYSVTVWGAMPLILLSPVAMSLFKVMENPLYVIPSFIVVLLFVFWVGIRILNGVSVIFDTSPTKTYLWGTLIIMLLLGGGAFYYDSNYATGSYVRFVAHVAMSAR